MLSLKSSPVLRILRQTNTIWSVFLMAGMANSGYLLMRFIGDRSAWAHPDQGALEYSDLGKLIMFATLVFGIIGILLAGITTELLGCPFTWTSRGLRKRLGLELSLLAAGATLVLATILLAKGAPLHVVGIPVLALAPGITLFDLRLGTKSTLASLALIFGLSVASDQLIALASHATLAPLLAGVGMLALALSWSLSRKAGRKLLTDSRLALGNASRHPFTSQPWERRLRAGVLPDTRWEGAPVRSATDRRAALEFERWGWSRGTWPIGRTRAAGVAVLIVISFGVLVALRAGLGINDGLKLIFALTGNTSELRTLGLENIGRYDLLSMATSGAIYLAFLTIGERMQPALRPGHLYPMSRTERADLLWRGSLENWWPQFGGLALAFLALTLVSGFLSGSSFSPRPPHFVVALAILAMGLPCFQLCSGLRELYPGERLAPWQVLTIMICLASGSGMLLFLGQTGIERLSTPLAWLAVLACLSLAIPAQFALRQILRRRLASMPLV